ncbi:MAG TPA: DNA polymerase III subunit delta [Ferruginibacter sp.]|nr:DNA polymerase III subunit delta [Ferruginibacter sp.]HRO17248.1 DNA polymerase III subunit delta [Ferruginibacter sp.]HRQ20878.1 DNA polymerase III subunit delta [Ferruginibacter sp.]
MSAAEKILTSWKKKTFKPLYWFQGEEDYEIDMLVQYAEHHILTEEEAAFNLNILYGKDAEWNDVINTCRSHPMFGSRQLIILKEAQLMKDIEKLEPYFQQPLNSTILIVAYKGKSLDKRKTFTKVVVKTAEVVETAKIKNDGQVLAWIEDYAHRKGFDMKPKAVALLFEHIGNDLSRISNEIDKLTLNIRDKKQVDESDIEKYIGISKEYNVFELQGAISTRNLTKALSIIRYFESNPKAGPIQLVIPTLYAFFNKVYVAHNLSDTSVNGLKAAFGNYYTAGDVKTAMAKYNFAETEKVILLLSQYNLKAVGIGNPGVSDGSLMKEMASKIILG